MAICLFPIILGQNISFSYKGQEIKIDGEFRNLPEWIAGRPVKLIASADVSFNRLIPGMFMTDLPHREQSTSEKQPLICPEILSLI